MSTERTEERLKTKIELFRSLGGDIHILNNQNKVS